MTVHRYADGDIQFRCKYLQPENGRKCAAGHCLVDYNLAWEGDGVGEIPRRAFGFSDKSDASVVESVYRVLAEVQCAHDTAARICFPFEEDERDAKFLEAFKNEANWVARQMNLEMPNV